MSEARHSQGMGCSACRQRRKRCDRASPKCSECKKSGAACVQISPPPTGIPQSYLELLDSKINELESAAERQDLSRISQALDQFGPRTTQPTLFRNGTNMFDPRQQYNPVMERFLNEPDVALRSIDTDQRSSTKRAQYQPPLDRHHRPQKAVVTALPQMKTR